MGLDFSDLTSGTFEYKEISGKDQEIEKGIDQIELKCSGCLFSYLSQIIKRSFVLVLCQVYSISEGFQVRATKLGNLPLSCLTIAHSTDAYPVHSLSPIDKKMLIS